MTGKVAIVTGGLSGIGAAVTERLTLDWTHVIAADIAAQSTALDGTPGIHPYRVDVTSPDSMASLIRAVMSIHGRIDCLVHCAGIGRIAPFLKTSLDTFDLVLRTNLYGAFIAGQACAAAMIATGGGTIVNIGSVSSERGNAGRAAYGASKAGVVALTEVMAVELAGHNVRVNAVVPGPIETPLAASQHGGPAREAWLRAVPMRRYGKPEDVANAVAFLCSDGARFVTGSILAVDGGFLAAGIPVSSLASDHSGFTD